MYKRIRETAGSPGGNAGIFFTGRLHLAKASDILVNAAKFRISRGAEGGAGVARIERWWYSVRDPCKER
jgi:hypothetical protein